MRFAVYLPFRIFFLQTYLKGHAAVVYIPVSVNAIGDGLAEPVGIFFSTLFREKWGIDVTYKTKSLYTSEGGFWSGNFTRSYPGSLCVFATTAIVLLIEADEFTGPQMVFLMCLMPFLMTMAEAYAPHTNDGPFLAIVGCGLLAVAFLAV